jgi:fumarylacetoacetate (FAA) hydrolase
MIAEGRPRTGFMAFGDRIRMEAQVATRASSFGAISQMIIGGAR